MNNSLDLNGLRARKARLAKSVGKKGYRTLLVLSGVFAVAWAGLLYENINQAYILGSLALICYAFAAWYNRELSVLPPSGPTLVDQLSGDILSRLPKKGPLTPKSTWHALSRHWQIVFLMNHLLLPIEAIEEDLVDQELDLTNVWNEAARLAQVGKSSLIEPIHVGAALMTTSEVVQQKLQQIKLSGSDVVEICAWCDRILQSMHREKPFFGGVGRDWANGFTPQLDRFGQNISLGIERGGMHYDWLAGSPGVKAIVNALKQRSNAIALIGDPGIGKTSHVYALAQVLLQGSSDTKLSFNQIVSLNSSFIISSAQRPGELESIMLTLMHETVHAGHIILFLDDAQLFFGDGPGAFDVTQILLPVIQSGNVRLILAMTPRDYQNLKTKNSAFAGLLTPVMLTEPPEEEVMHVLEDTAMSFEYRQKIVVTYESLREAYRLSGRYDQETAYPGKAIRLLEQSLPYATNQLFITDHSVQQAIEQTRGVKVGAANVAEADQLLHLEDRIHERMINQVHAVSVVASALRRARAGVANPRRPIGSFLFLGPTGVGKTELAKAIAATYFGAETNMVRLDMSEYQQPDDVRRLLSDGHEEAKSLIMAVRQQPFTVVLLDEIEKAHPNILNLLLQLLDEGELTDIGGRTASFKDCIVIATSNAGAQQIRDHIQQGEELDKFEDQLIDDLINSSQFKPELLNRFDEIVLFRPLKPEELAQVVKLMLGDINNTLANQHITVELTDAAIARIVNEGYDARLGARPMRRMLQRAVEDSIAGRILRGETKPGDHVTLDVTDLSA